jgi:hypothetical protein
LLCRLLEKPRRAETIVPPELLNKARTFVYLQHAKHQHSAEPGHVALIGAQWDAGTARRCGWEIATGKPNATLLLSSADDTNIAPFSNEKLVCFSDLKSSIQHSKTQREVEQRPSFFDEQKRDIWLVTEP